jgi:hypothetical protein
MKHNYIYKYNKKNKKNNKELKKRTKKIQSKTIDSKTKKNNNKQKHKQKGGNGNGSGSSNYKVKEHLTPINPRSINLDRLKLATAVDVDWSPVGGPPPEPDCCIC